MRSPPSALPVRARSGPSGSRSALAVAAALALVAWGCTSAPPPAPTRPTIDAADLPFLPSPVVGAPRAGDAELLRRVAAGHERLLAGDAGAATAAAEGALAVDPELDAAQVLLGQARLVGGDAAGAFEVLAPVASRFPGYEAARLATGLAADRLGDLVTAYASFRGASVPAAARRADELRPRAVEVLRERTEEALRRARLEEARQQLARLQEWAPDERSTLETALAVARAAGDAREELSVVRALVGATPGDEALQERHGELELSVGSPSAAIEIFQQLGRRHPQEPRFHEQLDLAKFRWRTVNLPAGVRELLQAPELSRADFAVLLYWLGPGVRAGVASSARIATDILDHPQRQEIMRVINLQLMEVDPTLRRFNPEARVRRGAALRALLRLLQRGTPAPSCVGPLDGNPSPSREAVCSAATACGLLPETADCLSEAGLSGAEAAEWIRRILSLLPA
jgi:hypothetical protein